MGGGGDKMHIELCKRISYAPFKFCPCVLHVPSHHHHHPVRDYINHYLTDTLCFLVLSSPMCNIFERGGGVANFRRYLL